MPKAAVIFDFFATLTPSVPSAVWDAHAARSAAPLGIPADRWRVAFDDSFAERAVGALGNLEQTVRTLAGRCGAQPDDDAVAAACAARTAAQRELFALRDDALATLAALRSAGLALGVLSDCTVELSEAWPTLPIASAVDARVLSCEEGRRKPDPELFRTVADRLRVRPEECWYVGDGGGNELTGATRAGMTAHMLRAADWSVGDIHGREETWPGPFLGSLTDVTALTATAGRPE